MFIGRTPSYFTWFGVNIYLMNDIWWVTCELGKMFQRLTQIRFMRLFLIVML